MNGTALEPPRARFGIAVLTSLGLSALIACLAGCGGTSTPASSTSTSKATTATSARDVAAIPATNAVSFILLPPSLEAKAETNTAEAEKIETTSVDNPKYSILYRPSRIWTELSRATENSMGDVSQEPHPPERGYRGSPSGCPDMTLSIEADTSVPLGAYDPRQTLAANIPGLKTGGSAVNEGRLDETNGTTIPDYVAQDVAGWSRFVLFQVPSEGRTAVLTLDVEPYPTFPEGASPACKNAFTAEAEAIVASARLLVR